MIYAAQIIYRRYISVGQRDVFNNPISIVDRETVITLPPVETEKVAVEYAKRWIAKLPLYSVPGMIRKTRGAPQIRIMQIDGVEDVELGRVAVQQKIRVGQNGHLSQRVNIAIIFDI